MQRGGRRSTVLGHGASGSGARSQARSTLEQGSCNACTTRHVARRSWLACGRELHAILWPCLRAPAHRPAGPRHPPTRPGGTGTRAALGAGSSGADRTLVGRQMVMPHRATQHAAPCQRMRQAVPFTTPMPALGSLVGRSLTMLQVVGIHGCNAQKRGGGLLERQSRRNINERGACTGRSGTLWSCAAEPHHCSPRCIDQARCACGSGQLSNEIKQCCTS